MFTLKQATIISVAALLGILFLWLERTVGGGTGLVLFTPTFQHPATMMAVFISAMTSPVAAVTVAIGGAIIAGFKHHERLWLLFAGLLTITASASLFLKEAFALPRPELALWDLTTFGFPSGHTAVATVALVMIVWFSYHASPAEDHHRTIFWGTFIWAIICLSRILLGVHSFSDVLAGILLGTAIASLAVWAADTMIARHWLILGELHDE